MMNDCRLIRESSYTMEPIEIHFHGLNLQEKIHNGAYTHFQVDDMQFLSLTTPSLPVLVLSICIGSVSAVQMILKSGSPHGACSLTCIYSS